MNFYIISPFIIEYINIYKLLFTLKGVLLTNKENYSILKNKTHLLWERISFIFKIQGDVCNILYNKQIFTNYLVWTFEIINSGVSICEEESINNPINRFNGGTFITKIVKKPEYSNQKCITCNGLSTPDINVYTIEHGYNKCYSCDIKINNIQIPYGFDYTTYPEMLKIRGEQWWEYIILIEELQDEFNASAAAARSAKYAKKAAKAAHNATFYLLDWVVQKAKYNNKIKN